MDITRFLPDNQYQAAINANAPTALNPFATIADLIADNQTLSEVLGNGNTTADGQTIDALNGGGSLNLRNAADNFIRLGNTTSFITLEDSYLTLGAGVFFSDPVVNGLEMNANFTQLTLTKGDFTKLGLLGLKYNDAAPGITANVPAYPSVASSQNASISVGVINTTILGGDTIIGKTNNTGYVNQIGFNAGLAGEMLLQHTASASDFVATLKAETGTIAYLTDISAGGNLYANDGTITGQRTVDLATFGLTLDASTSPAKNPLAILNGRVSSLDGTAFTFGMDGVNKHIILEDKAFFAGQKVELVFQEPTQSTSDHILTLPKDATGTIALLSDVASIYGANGVVGPGRVATLTDTLEFTGGQTTFRGAGNTVSTYAFRTENSDNDRLTTIDDAGKVVTGVADSAPVADWGTSAFVVKAGLSNNGLQISNANTDGVTPNTTGHNVNLTFTTRDSAGNVATTMPFFVRNRNVTAGSVYGVLVISNAIQTENSTGTTGRTLICNQNRHTSGSASAVCNVLNADAGSDSTVMLVDSFNQNASALSFGIRTSSNGTNANTWNWRLKANHEFEHNYGQLSTGDFIMRGLTDANLFRADASADKVGIGVAAPASKLTVSGGDIEVIGQNDGLIVKDRTSGVRYRIYVDSTGTLFTETA